MVLPLLRLHDVRGELSNVPRDSAALYGGGEFFLLYRMKVLIIVWGTSNRGKSQSIKQLALSFPFSSIIRPWDEVVDETELM